MLLAAAAMLFAGALVEAALPFVNRFLETDMALTWWGSDGVLLPSLALILVVGGLGGLYPALFLSRFQPARVLKANRSGAEAEGSGRLRNALVVGQFAVSIGLIICTAIIQSQTDYARTVDPGYRRDGVLQIGQLSRAALQPRLATLTREIDGLDGIVSTGRSTIGVDTWGMENMTVTAPGASESVEFELYRVDPGFFRNSRHRARRRPYLRRRHRDGRQHARFARRRSGRCGDGAARLQCGAEPARRPAAGLCRSTPGGRQDPARR